VNTRPASNPEAGLFRGWAAFWLTPVNPAGLRVLRVLGGLLFLGWLLPFAGNVDSFFGPTGWFDVRAYHETVALDAGSSAPLGWSLLYVCGSSSMLHAFYWGIVGILVLFTFGICTRITAVLTWLIVASFLASPAASFEGDYLLNILALYLMLGHLLLGQWSQPLSTSERLLGSKRISSPSIAANLTLRLVQVHFAIVLLVSGLHKLQFGDWWSGVAYWYPLNPAFELTPERLRLKAAHAGSYLFVLSLLQYLALAWQLTFPFFAWRRRWRPMLLVGAVAGWIGSVVIYRQPLFGPVLMIVCLSYLTPEEWCKLGSLRSRFVALLRASRIIPAQGEPVHV
jgi:hypothetical protein